MLWCYVSRDCQKTTHHLLVHVASNKLHNVLIKMSLHYIFELLTIKQRSSNDDTKCLLEQRYKGNLKTIIDVERTDENVSEVGPQESMQTDVKI